LNTVATQRGRNLWFRFDRRMFHVKLCAANDRVTVGALALGMR
jgi:hypothetical protein